MPRTKQNNPKNIKDKIEEAQKELKDPKAGEQKGASEGVRRSADNIKGLKRKKIVTENQQKKILKSPVKKPLQSKTSLDTLQGASSKEATPSCSYPNSPSQNLASSPCQSRDTDYVQPVSKCTEVSSIENDRIKHKEALSSEPQSPMSSKGESFSNVGEFQQIKDSKSGKPSFEVDSSYQPSAPLEVLLKAMEPDFSSLTERKKYFQEPAVAKPSRTLSTHSRREESAMPAVNFRLQSPTYFVNKQENINTMQSSTQAASLQTLQHAAKQFSNRGAKPSLQMSFSTGPSATLTHAPVPLGPNSLPQSQPPVVHTCQSLSASVPSTIQVPVTPGYSPVQMATVVNFGLEQICSLSAKDQKPKKQGKYVCEYCSRACAKPSVLLKHIRSHTGERPYPCVTCGFSFKTKSNLYKHKKSHAHAIKLGLVARSDSGTGSLSVESDKAVGTHSDVEESGDSDEESSTADLDPDSSQSSVAAFSESSLQSAGTTQGNHGDAGDTSAVCEMLKQTSSQMSYESKGTAGLPKVVVYPVNVSPLRADSPRVTDSSPEQATAQRQRDFQSAHLRSSITVLSSLKEVDCTSPLQDAGSEDEDQQCRCPPGGGHGQLQRQQATDFSQQQQGKCLLSPRSLGSTDSGYFSRSESADQAMSPPSPFVKITPPTDMDVTKNALPIIPAGVATVLHVASMEKTHVLHGQMRPPLETKALSLEERISKLISDNEAVVDDKQLDSVKPRRTSLSRRGSIDSPKSYIFKDSFQFDLKPMARRSSSSSDIPKSPFTPTEKNKPVFLLSVPNQFSPMECLPITRSNSMPTSPGHSTLPPNITQQPHPLRICQSFEDKIGSLNDDVFSSDPSTPNPAIHSRTLVRQVAVEDFSTSEGLTSVRSMDEGYHMSRVSTEIMQRSKSYEHAQERNRKSQQAKGTMYECETCRNRYRKLENFENHKKFYCSELHGPKNLKPVSSREPEQDVFHRGMSQQFVPRIAGISGIMDQQQSIRKRRKMKSVGDDDDQSPTDTNPPCSVSFDSCQLLADSSGQSYSKHSVMVDLQPESNPPAISQIQLVARGTESTESRLLPIRESQVNTCSKERSDLQRQGSGTSVIKHTNSLSRPNSFETSESIDRASPVDFMDKDGNRTGKSKADPTANLLLERYHEKMSIPKCADQGKQGMENCVDRTLTAAAESCAAVQQSRLVRQNNIPEILVTEEPDREHEGQTTEQVEKATDTFNWPQRSESLSKLPTEKLPPKKKRIRLAQIEQSSGESSFESSLSRSLSRDSSLSRCSSISASFDRDDPSRSESPSRGECVNKVAEPQGLPLAFNTLGVPGMMRRAASEQISCTQPSVEISCDYRSKSFDCGSVSSIRSLSPNRSLSPIDLPKNAQPSVHIPLIERRRGPLVRQMSLKIGPESQQHVGKHTMPLQRLPTVFSTSLSRPQQIQQIANKPLVVQPFVLHSRETKNEKMVQSINLGSQSQLPQVHGLPHPWHQTSRIQTCQKLQQSVVNVMVSQEDAGENKSAESQDRKMFVPKYQMQYPVLSSSQTYTFSSTQATPTTLPILTIPIASQMQGISKSSDVIHNVHVAQHSPQVGNKTEQIILPVGLQNGSSSQTQTGSSRLPQILITHEQMHPSHTISNKESHSNLVVIDGNTTASPDLNKDRPPASAGLQVKPSLVSSAQNPAGETQRASTLGSLHCTQKMAAVTLCPQQEPIASSKRMLSPANSLDIAMEKHQKRAKDEHGAACLTDGRSVNYLNSKMAEVTRQRKLMLVRQVCTTEPADSPIETEAPPLQHDKAVERKDSQSSEICKNITPESTGQGEPYTAVPPEHPSSALSTNPGNPVSSMLANATLKPQDKVEEQRLASAKSPIRPLTFHGQVKLASSVSVVNTRDSHRLSFPSLKTATTFTWCYLMKRRPLHLPQTDQKISAYSTWAVSPKNPNPLGLPTKVAMSLFDSKQNSKKIHYTEAITTSMKSDILAYSSKLKDIMPKILKPRKSLSTDNSSKGHPETQTNSELDKDPSTSKLEPRRIKIFDGGFKSNEDYVYVRGRGRGKYICEECGIRCKKPSMLRKHIRTHSDVRPFHCTHCNFSFKTKGNLTKHMKSKAHSKKCLEMGVSAGLDDQDAEDSGDRSQVGSTDHPDSDGDDSEGADDDNEDDNEEEEEDSLSGLSTNPSVSASPQHISSTLQAELPPSSLLAQMSIHQDHHPPVPPPCLPRDASDAESVPMLSPVSLVKQMSISGSCTSPGPMPYSPPPNALTSDSHASDTESVHMMSPVSPCRQMSIDYPDFDGPPTPPTPGKGCSKLGQNGSLAPPQVPLSESSVGTDVSTQTSSFAQPSSCYAPQTSSYVPQTTSYVPQTSSYGSLHFPPQSLTQGPGSSQGGHTHLFSHLPLHSQQPSRSPYSMVPVGGIQLVPAGLAAYSTFVPIQAGPVQLTIPAVSVIHQNTSPLPFPSSPQPDGAGSQPLVVQEPVSSVMPCFPLGQVAGLQAVGASHQTLQSMGLDTLSVMGLAGSGCLSSSQLLSQHGLTLNATLGLQVLAASPTSQSSIGPQHHQHAHIPGLQILNIALPALIPTLSPLPGPSEKQGSPETPDAPRASSLTEPVPPGASVSCATAASSPPTFAAATLTGSPAPEVMSSDSQPCGSWSGSAGGAIQTQTAEDEERVTPSLQHTPTGPTATPQGGVEEDKKPPAGGASEPVTLQRQSQLSRQKVTQDYDDDSASSDDEGRLVIAT